MKEIDNFKQFALNCKNPEKLFYKFHHNKTYSQKSNPIYIGFNGPCENEISQVNITLGYTEYIPGQYKIVRSETEYIPGKYITNTSVLIYAQNQDKSVVVTLRPKKSNDYIIIEFLNKTDCLLNEKYIKKHYKYLLSCFADKSYKENMIKLKAMDKLRYWYINLFKKYISSDCTIPQRPKIYEKINFLLKYPICKIILFLLGAFIIAFISWLVPDLMDRKNESKMNEGIEGKYMPHGMEGKDNSNTNELVEEADELIDKNDLYKE